MLLRMLEIRGNLFFNLTETIKNIKYEEYRESHRKCVESSILPPVTIRRCLQKCVKSGQADEIFAFGTLPNIFCLKTSWANTVSMYLASHNKYCSMNPLTYIINTSIHNTYWEHLKMWCVNYKHEIVNAYLLTCFILSLSGSTE